MYRIGLPASLACLTPSAAEACAVCFGAESPDLARGFYWGIVVLLTLPPVMILALAGLIAFHVKKNRRLLHPSVD